MELALEFWSLPFQFLSNASANLLVFIAKCLGVSWDPLGSMDLIHGSDPWTRSMDQIHLSDGVKNRTFATKWVGNRICELSIGGTEAEI